MCNEPYYGNGAVTLIGATAAQTDEYIERARRNATSMLERTHPDHPDWLNELTKQSGARPQ